MFSFEDCLMSLNKPFHTILCLMHAYLYTVYQNISKIHINRARASSIIYYHVTAASPSINLWLNNSLPYIQSPDGNTAVLGIKSFEAKASSQQRQAHRPQATLVTGADDRIAALQVSSTVRQQDRYKSMLHVRGNRKAYVGTQIVILHMVPTSSGAGR